MTSGLATGGRLRRSAGEEDNCCDRLLGFAVVVLNLVLVGMDGGASAASSPKSMAVK